MALQADLFVRAAMRLAERAYVSCHAENDEASCETEQHGDDHIG
jgi:hypothetical protein